MNNLDQTLRPWEMLAFDAEGSGFTSSCNTWIRVASFFSLLWLIFSSSINMLQYYIVCPQSISCSLKQLERAKLRERFPLPNFFFLFFVPRFSLAHIYLIFLILHLGFQIRLYKQMLFLRELLSFRGCSPSLFLSLDHYCPIYFTLPSVPAC